MGRIHVSYIRCDCRIAVWDISNQIFEAASSVAEMEQDPTLTAVKFDKPLFWYQAHQSGVNALQAVLHQGFALQNSGR